MIFGHPPPVPSPLRTQLLQRLAYLRDLVQVGLDDHISVSDPAQRQACQDRIRAYISHVEALIASLSDAEPAAYPVLMDIPVCVVEQETGTAEWFTVVGPNEADTASGKISLLSPLGWALLLKRTGETVELSAPGGRYRYRVGAVGNALPEAQ